MKTGGFGGSVFTWALDFAQNAAELGWSLDETGP